MKKRKILYLFPLTALLLSGCSIQEGWNAVKHWVGENIYFPVANWISGEDAEKDEKKEDQGIKRIAIETWPTEVAQGSTVLTSSVTVHVYYSDGTEAIKEAEEVVCDTSTPGETELIAKFGGKEAKKIVTVISAAEVVHVESIRWTVKQGINVGEQVQIQVTFTPDNATDKSLSFQSEHEDILTVTGTGLVTGVAPGQAKVRVTPLDNPEACKDINFTVNPPSQGLPGKTTKNYEKLAAKETLLNGEKVSIVGSIGEDYYAMQNYTEGNNIRGHKTDLTDEGLAVDDADEFTVIAVDEGIIALMQANGKYLAATGSSSNKLQAADTIGDSTKWTYEVDENGVAHITAPAAARGSLRLNPNNGTPIFNCYAETTTVSGSDYAIYHDGNGSTGEIHVESVAFAESEYTVEVGQSLAINAAVSPATATNKNISYELLDIEPEGAVSIDGNTLTGALVGTATLKATSQDNQAATATASIKIVDAITPEHAGTLEDPYSPEDAKIVIDKGMEATDKYAAGIVSKIVTPYDDGYKNISFNISSDGSEDKFQLQGFRTKGTEEYPIASNDDVQVGDHVILHGNLTKYGSTYEFGAGNQLVFHSREAVLVESIALDPAQAEMTVGLADLTLTASVLPENATEKSLTWSSSDETVATVENGVVHAVAEGDVVITAAATDGSGIEGTASIHVSVPAKEVVGVVVSTMPKVEYNEDEVLDLTGMELTITYNDESVDEHVTTGYTTNIALDKELTPEDTQLVVSYGGVEADPIALTVTPKPQPVHAGTAADPYTINDCEIVYANAKLEQGKDLGAEIYVAGTILAEPAATINNGRGRLYIGDASSENSLYIYNINNVGNSANLTLADIPAGSEIVAKGTLKNFNGAMQMCYVKDVANCELISVVKPTVLVSEIQLSSTEENLVVGLADLTLTASVLPENATDKSLTWASSNEAVATVENGVVHAVAEGEAVITAAATDGSGIEATCTVHVSVPNKELVSVQVKTMPKVEYNEGDKLDLSDLVLTLYYDDQTTEDVTTGYTTNIALDHELTTEDTELIITYGEFDLQPITLTVTAKPQPVHAGTAADPYTVSDAKIIFDGLADGEINGECYVTGTIADSRTPSVSSGRGRFDLTDGICETPLYVYNINNIGGSNNLTVADIPVGSVVVAKGTIKNYGGTFELCYNASNPSIACELISIVKPVIAPETVTITSGSELGVGSDMNLTATVGPEGAAQDVEWTIVTGGDYATLSDGVLTGVAAGDVTVRATAVGYENVYAEKTITVSSSVVPTEQVVYTLDGTVTATGNAYATATVLTQGGVEWSVTGNTEMNPWRIGGKGLTNVDRPVSSNGIVSTENISKVAVDIGATGSSLTLNSVTLKVGTTAGGSDISTQTVTANITNNVVEFERPANANWASAYFTVVFNVTRTSTSGNGYVILNAITFYAVI